MDFFSAKNAKRSLQKEKRMIYGLTIDLNDKKICHLCEKQFGIEELGLLSCFIHPLPINHLYDGINYKRGQYECCGITPDFRDHKNSLYSNCKGCIRIDHVTKEEIDKLLEKPYVCIPKTLYITLKSKRMSSFDGENKILAYEINHEDEMIIGTLKRYLKSNYLINMEIEYQEMLIKYAITDQDLNKKIKLSVEYSQYKTSREEQAKDFLVRSEKIEPIRKTNNKYEFTIKRIMGEFVPFCIIRRIEEPKD